MTVKNFISLFSVTLFLVFTNTVDQIKVALPSLFDFVVYDLLAFIEKNSALAVSNQHTFNSVIGEVVCCNFACEGSFSTGTDILCSNKNSIPENGLYEW